MNIGKTRQLDNEFLRELYFKYNSLRNLKELNSPTARIPTLGQLNDLDYLSNINFIFRLLELYHENQYLFKDQNNLPLFSLIGDSAAPVLLNIYGSRFGEHGLCTLFKSLGINYSRFYYDGTHNKIPKELLEQHLESLLLVGYDEDDIIISANFLYSSEIDAYIDSITEKDMINSYFETKLKSFDIFFAEGTDEFLDCKIIPFNEAHDMTNQSLSYNYKYAICLHYVFSASGLDSECCSYYEYSNIETPLKAISNLFSFSKLIQQKA